MNYICTSMISYLFGSFSTAYFIAKAKDFDIRDRGSMNAGASNIKINLGWGYGILTGFCDMLKTIIAIRLSSYLFPNDAVIPFLAGAMSIVGHIFPFYLHFKGGKGFASYIGMLLAIDWKFALAIMVLTAVLMYATNYIVIATFTVIAVTPLYFLWKGAGTVNVLILAAVAALIAYKHRVNIGRIIRGEEIGVREKKKKKAEQ